MRLWGPESLLPSGAIPCALLGQESSCDAARPWALRRTRGKVPAIRQFHLVPLAGLEPARCFHHLILSQARLPIPPQGLKACGSYRRRRRGQRGNPRCNPAPKRAPNRLQINRAEKLPTAPPIKIARILPQPGKMDEGLQEYPDKLQEVMTLATRIIMATAIATTPKMLTTTGFLPDLIALCLFAITIHIEIANSADNTKRDRSFHISNPLSPMQWK
jgi:hypothetical protein